MTPNFREWVFVTFEPEFWGLNEIRGGGGAIRPYELFTTLARLGAECHVFETERNNPRIVEGVNVSPVLSGKSKVIDEVWKRIRIVQVFRRFCHDVTDSGRKVCLWQKLPAVTFWKWGTLPVPARPFYLTLFAKQFGAYTWVSIHDISPEYDISLSQRYCSYHKKRYSKWRGILPRYFESIALKLGARADLVTTVSEEMKNICQDRFARSDVGVFRSGVNRKLVESISTWEAPTKTWTLGYLGSYLDGDLNLLTEALRAHSRTQSTVRLLVGTHDPDTLRTLMKNVNINVELIEAHYSDFPDVAERVDFWIVPYGEDPMWRYCLNVTWALKTPMYVATGRPVIITKTAEVEHTGLKPYLFLSANDPESMAKTIEYVISNPEEAKRKAEAGREFVLTEMTWEKVIGQLIERLARSAECQELESLALRYS